MIFNDYNYCLNGSYELLEKIKTLMGKKNMTLEDKKQLR